MAVDKELKRRADHKDLVRKQISKLVEAGTGTVSDGDMSVQLIDLASLRREERRAMADENRHLIQRAGGSILGFFPNIVEPGTPGTVYEDVDA